MMQLSAHNIRLTREKNGAVFHVHIPSMYMRTGDVIAVVGESGCGKSTLLDILALILRPDAGSMSMECAGRKKVSLTRANAAALAHIRSHDLGYVLQTGGLLPFLNVRDNILMPAKILGLDKKSTEARLQNLLELLKITDQKYKNPQHLSGGQRQRVAIARALIHKPSLVLADEPTAAVDSKTAEDICKMFQEVVKNSGAAAVIVSHDRSLMLRYANAIAEFTVEKLSDDEALSTLKWPTNLTSSS